MRPLALFPKIYDLMDGRGQITVDDNPALGVIEAKPGFAISFASNPDHPEFELDEPLASRFTAMPELLTDWNLARDLVGTDKTWTTIVDACENLDAKRRNGEVTVSPQFREIRRARKMSDRKGMQVALSTMLTFIHRVGVESDLEIATETFERALGVGNLSTLTIGGK